MIFWNLLPIFYLVIQGLLFKQLFGLGAENASRCQKCYEKSADCFSCKIPSEDVPQLLGDLSEKVVSELRINLIHPLPYLIYGNPPLDIRNISSFSNLTQLVISGHDVSEIQSYRLIIENNTFAQVPLKTLRINTGITDVDVHELVNGLKSITYLNFSTTFDIGMKNIKALLRALKDKPITHLDLSGIQYPGGKQYTCIFNISGTFKDGSSNLSTVRMLNISSNGISFMNTGLYDIFPNLQVLDISENAITGLPNAPAYMEMGLHPNLVELYVLNEGYATKYDYKDVPDKSEEANMSQILWPVSVSSLKRKSQYIFLFEKVLGCFNTFISGNVTNAFIDRTIFCKIIKCLTSIAQTLSCDLLPPLPDLYDSESAILIKIPIGHNLKVFEFSGKIDLVTILFGAAQYKIDTKKLVAVNNSLQIVKLKTYGVKNKYKSSPVLSRPFSVEGIENIVLYEQNSKNEIPVNLKSLCFTLPNVKYLNMAKNIVVMKNGFRICDVSACKQLMTLDISESCVQNVPNFLITECLNLTYLNMDNNNITEFNLLLPKSRIFSHISLRNNNIKTISQPMMEHLDSTFINNAKFKLDLSGNPLSCACTQEAAIFVKWALQTSILSNKSNLICYGKNGPQFLQGIVLERYMNECFPSHVIMITITVITTLSVVAVCCCILIMYKKRHKIRYMFFKLSQLFRHRSDFPEKYKYDAFISYCADDRFWVHDTLMKTLEDTYNFGLCIHYRDFPVGDPIVEAITENIASSRELIIVMSDYYLHPDREWCRFEAEHIQMIALRRNKPVLIIKLGCLKSPITSLPMAHLLDTQVILPWPEEDRETENNTSNRGAGIELFWAKLVDELYRDANECKWCLGNRARSVRADVVGQFAEDTVMNRGNSDVCLINDYD